MQSITERMAGQLKGKERRAATTRPKLTADSVVDYLDWIVANVDVLPRETITTHMQAAELAIRTRSNEAQAKATQHTLVEQGIIDQPNT